MTTYRSIAATETDPDSPVTSTLVIALADNPTAIAEGGSVTGTPVNAATWHPYDLITLDGSQDGEIWSFATNGAVDTIVTPTFEDRFEYMLWFDSVEMSVSGQTSMEAFFDGPAAYFVITLLGAQTAGIAYSGMVRYIMPRVLSFDHKSQWEENPVTDVAGQSIPQVLVDEHNATKSVIDNIRLTITTVSNFDAGAIKMLRRRVFVP